MNAKDFIQWKAKMCNEHNCEKCDLGKAASDSYMACSDYISCHTDEAIRIVQKYREKKQMYETETYFIEKKLREFDERILLLKRELREFREKIK